MTLKELYQLRDLRREIEIDKERLAELETQATHITARLTGTPSGSGDGRTLERSVAAIADMRQIIEAKQDRINQELRQVELYVQSIPDSLTRQIFIFRFEQGKSWRWIAVKTRNTEQNVRKICSRYVRDNQ